MLTESLRVVSRALKVLSSQVLSKTVFGILTENFNEIKREHTQGSIGGECPSSVAICGFYSVKC